MRAVVGRWLRGMLERLREHTRGADVEIVAMMRKLDDGDLVWTGPQPFGWAKPKPKPKPKDGVL